jgi:tetratricopeptide (TPR) repeat protein
LTDRYGLVVTTASASALGAYVEAVDLLLAALPGAEEAFGRALTADPRFALAEAGRARTLQLLARMDEARAAARHARELAAPLSRRERQHVEVLALVVEGQGAAALHAARTHLREFPRDAMVLAPCTGVFGLIGFSGRQGREAEMLALLDGLATHYGDDWWFGMAHAFAQNEAGQPAAARKTIDRAMAAHPRNAHGAHVRAHVLYENGEDAAGLAYLDEWLKDYPASAQLHCHLSWHVAIFSLGVGRLDRAWQAYVSGVAPGASWGPPVNTLTDAASFLWRAELAGAPRDAARWSAVRDYALGTFPKPGVAFCDVHSAAAYAASGDTAGLEELSRALRASDSAGRLAAGPVVPALADAFGAFARGDWDATIASLTPVFDQHVRIGGSRAQRDLVEFTLLAAYLRAGRADEAQALLARRHDRRPSVPVNGSREPLVSS